MIQVSTREFQLNLSKYLGELPILLTRYGRPVAVVRMARDLKEVTSTKEPKVDYCRHGTPRYLCWNSKCREVI